MDDDEDEHGLKCSQPKHWVPPAKHWVPCSPWQQGAGEGSPARPPPLPAGTVLCCSPGSGKD